MNAFKFVVNDILQDKSIRELLSYFHLGKDKVKSFINDKCFFVNGNNVDIDFLLKKNDLLEIKLNEKIDIAPFNKDLDVLYEDDYYLVINKPKDILIHSDGVNVSECLNNMVSNYYKVHHIRRSIRVANRLDYQTSGIVIYSKDCISESMMDYLIRERLVEKKYYAACYNKFSNKEGLIDLPIARNRHDSKKMIVNKKGKEAKTEYKVIKNGKISVCDVTLLTGRTHQIRVHLSYLNHSLVGDSLYGKNDGFDLMLQAYFVRFIHPFTNKEVLIKIDMGESIKSYCKAGK